MIGQIKTILFIQNALIVRGIVSCLQQIAPETRVEVFEKINYSIESDQPVIIVDRDLLSESPEHTLNQLKRKYAHCKIILLSASNPPDGFIIYIDECILITDSGQQIIEKLQHVFVNISSSVSPNGQNSVLSDREREVLRLVALGFTNREISDELCISTHTVITHRKNITAKLSIKTIAGLAVYAVLNGIISSDELNTNSTTRI